MKTNLLKKVRIALKINKAIERENQQIKAVEDIIFKARSINEFCAAKRILDNHRSRLTTIQFSHLLFVFNRKMEQMCLNSEHVEEYLNETIYI